MLYNPDETRQQTRDLWRTCFGDSEEFMDVLKQNHIVE